MVRNSCMAGWPPAAGRGERPPPWATSRCTSERDREQRQADPGGSEAHGGPQKQGKRHEQQHGHAAVGEADRTRRGRPRAAPASTAPPRRQPAPERGLQPGAPRVTTMTSAGTQMSWSAVRRNRVCQTSRKSCANPVSRHGGGVDERHDQRCADRDEQEHGTPRNPRTAAARARSDGRRARRARRRRGC